MNWCLFVSNGGEEAHKENQVSRPSTLKTYVQLISSKNIPDCIFKQASKHFLILYFRWKKIFLKGRKESWIDASSFIPAATSFGRNEADKKLNTHEFQKILYFMQVLRKHAINEIAQLSFIIIIIIINTVRCSILHPTRNHPYLLEGDSHF